MFYLLTISLTLIAGVSAFFYKCFKKPFSFSFPWKKSTKTIKNSNPTPPEVYQTPEERAQNLQKQRNLENRLKVYEKALSELAVGAVKMTSHHYLSMTAKDSSNTTKIKRLTSEMKQISTFLPIYYSNAIFVRYDESKMDYMKAMIMGADGTPYANGAFLYDIYFDDTYPRNPPKVNLMTTGGQKVRFNPNLYNNGYVCLSLLGTWSGSKGETWTSNSNLLQVLISIQSLVMNEDVLYNEPSYEMYRNPINSHGPYNQYKKQNIGYSNIVRYGNVKYAMLGSLENPPKGFEDVVKMHFFYKKKEIIKTCSKWVEEAKNQKDLADYTGLVTSHNYELANAFLKSKDAYCNELTKEVENLKKKLKALNI